jgi:hypothetical protein
MTPRTLAIVFLATFCAAQNPTIDVYVGGSNGTSPTKIKMRYNIAMQQTVISSKDFNCTVETNCLLMPTPSSLNLGNQTVTVYTAQVPVNLRNSVFNESMTVYFLANDTSNVGSVIGLSKDSSFLAYYSTQNRKAGYQVAFNLDSLGDIDFHQFTGSDYTALGPGPFNAVITTKYGSSWNVSKTKMCFANTIDDNASNNSIIGVARSNYTNWYNFFNTYYQKEADSNYFYVVVTDPNGNYVTQFNYLMKDLVSSGSSNPTWYIRQVPDEYAAFRGCDLFTGNLLLQKFDFHLAYSETANGFNYNYMLKSPSNLINPPESDSGVSGWVILLVLILLGVAGYFGYQWYLNRQTADVPLNDGYVSMNIQPVELNELPRMTPPR